MRKRVRPTKVVTETIKEYAGEPSKRVVTQGRFAKIENIVDAEQGKFQIPKSTLVTITSERYQELQNELEQIKKAKIDAESVTMQYRKMVDDRLEADRDKETQPQRARETALENLVQMVRGDLEGTMEKADEYGAIDLEIMGFALRKLLEGPPVTFGTEEEANKAGMEMAIAFYELGKIARCFSAYRQGQLPKDDTWLDTTIYSMMARHVRKTGSWGKFDS